MGERGDTVAMPGSEPETFVISRTETGCQLSVASAVRYRDVTMPQPLSGICGMSCLPVELISTTCGGMRAR